MSRICPLFSGSSGNSTYIASECGSLLIDIGVSFRAVTATLNAVGGSPEEISAVLITHEHTDHIKGLKTLLKHIKVPVLASEATLNTLVSLDIIPPGAEVLSLDEGNEAELGGFGITRFPTLHDCTGSSGYSVRTADGRKISVCTDLGKVTDSVRSAISGSDVILIESNHDIDMLKKGPYPPALKMRILSDNGHISNNACAAELPNLLKNGTRRFILGHLSRKNNSPLLAFNCAQAALVDCGAKDGVDYTLSVAAPTGNGVTVV